MTHITLPTGEKCEIETFKITIPMGELLDSIPEEDELNKLIETYNSLKPKFYGLHRL
jgi:hypothetical protein